MKSAGVVTARAGTPVAPCELLACLERMTGFLRDLALNELDTPRLVVVKSAALRRVGEARALAARARRTGVR
jgi:hypothetical protein